MADEQPDIAGGRHERIGQGPFRLLVPAGRAEHVGARGRHGASGIELHGRVELGQRLVEAARAAQHLRLQLVAVRRRGIEGQRGVDRLCGLLEVVRPQLELGLVHR